jgi:hypothetical protein
VIILNLPIRLTLVFVVWFGCCLVKKKPEFEILVIVATIYAPNEWLNNKFLIRVLLNIVLFLL